LSRKEKFSQTTKPILTYQCDLRNFVAVIYTGLGEKEKAFQWLTKAYEQRSAYMYSIKTDPTLDPRFIELCKKIGLQM